MLSIVIIIIVTAAAFIAYILVPRVGVVLEEQNRQE